MANDDERIETYVNRNGIQGDTDFFLEKLRELDEAFARVNNIKLDLNKSDSFRMVIDNAGKLSQATKTLATNVDNYRAIQDQATKAMQDASTASAGQGDAAIKQANALAALKLAQQQNAALQKEYKKQLDNGTLSLEQYQEKLGVVILKQAEYKASILTLNKELANATKVTPTPASPAAANIPLEIIPTVQDAPIPTKTRQESPIAPEATDEALAFAQAQRTAAKETKDLAGAIKEELTPLELSATVLAEQRLALAANAKAQRDYKTELAAGQITMERYLEKTGKAIIEQNELKVSIAALNKELSTAAKAGFAVPFSQPALEAQNAALVAERGSIPTNTVDPQEIQRRKEINDLIDKNNELIRINSSLLEQQRINIGNYPTEFRKAFTTLESELGRVNTALKQEGLSGKEISDLTVKQQALQNATALVTKEFSSTTAQTNAYKESAKQIGQVYGTNSEVFKTYSTQVGEGVAQTKKIGEEVEKAGKKTGGLAKGLSSIWSALRQIAYAIPGIGIAGLIGLLLDPLTALAASLFKVKGAAADSIEDIKRYDEALASAEPAAVKAVEELQNLRESIDQAKAGFVSKNEVVKLYNDTLGKTMGYVNSLDEAEQNLVKNGDAFIKYTLLKAAAQAAASKAAEQLVKAAEEELKPLSDYKSLLVTGRPNSSISPTGGGFTYNQQEDEAQAKLEKEGQERRQQAAVKGYNDTAEKYQKVYQKFVDQINQVANISGFGAFGGDDDPLKARATAQIKDIEEQIQALTRYQDKQSQVAQTDTNTYEQRREALVNYNKAAQQIIGLNTQKDLVGPKSLVGQLIAQNKLLDTSTEAGLKKQKELQAAIASANGDISLIYSRQQTGQLKASQDGYNRLHDLDESYRLRKLTAEEQLAEDQINQVIKTNEVIYKDDQKSLEDRLAAYKAYINAQAQLLDTQRNEKLSAAGFSDQEIANFKAGLEVQLQGKKVTSEELQAIEADYQSKLAALSANGAKDVHDITVSWAKKTAEDVKIARNQVGDTALADQYNAEVQALNRSYQQRLISVLQYQNRKSALDRQFAIDQLNQQVANDDKQLSEQDEYNRKLAEKIQQAYQDLINAKETGTPEEIDENQARLDALLQAEGDQAAKILAIRRKLASDTSALLAKSVEEQKARDLQVLQYSADIAKKSLDILQAQVDGRYDNERQQIQDTIDDIKAKAQADIDAVNATNASAQDKAKAIADINSREAAQEKQLQDRQKQLDIEKAEFDKEKAILDIGINTAVAVAKAYAQGPTGIAMVPFIVAMGALEIALVESQRIPTYKYGAGVNGRPKHPGGIGEVGHGKPEIVITPAGEAFVTPSTPTRLNLPRDTTILPDAKAVIDNVINHSLLSFDPYTTPAPDIQLLQSNQQLRKEIRVLQQIVANKRETHVHGTWAGLEVMFRQGYSWMKYVDGNTNFMRRNK